MANVTHIYGNEVTDAAARGSLAPAYSASSTYAVGDLVLHEGQLYECSTAISTAEAWTAAHWTAKTVADEVTDLKGGLTEKYTKPSGGIPSTDMTSEVQTSLGKADSAYQKPSGGIPATDLASGVIPSVPVTDVQVNGSSVLSNGVANVPVTSENTAGVAKINPVYGIHLRDAPNNDQLMIYKADSSLIKAGSNQHRPIVPQKQHESVFYGLAKSAGDSSQSESSNSVGTYTDAAKVAIQKMLGVYEAPFRLINTISITEATAKVYVNTDSNGDSFALKEVIIYLDSMTANGNGGTGGVCVNNDNNYYGIGKPYLYLGNMYMSTATSKIIRMAVRGGRFFADGSQDALSLESTRTSLYSSKNAMGIIDCNPIYELCIGCSNGYNFTSGTIYIYGR